MPYVVSLATPGTRALVVGALRSAASQRTRVATKAAREVAATKATGKDVRSQSVKVTALLAEAAELGDLADTLDAATEVAVLSVDQSGRIETVPIPDPTHTAPAAADDEDTDDEGTDDDGLSAAAHAAADLAGLTPAIEDPLTGALPEDDPTEPEDVNL